MQRPPAQASERSEISPQTIMESATNTGAQTGPTQGRGIRNKMSQVPSDCGQWIISFKNA